MSRELKRVPLDFDHPINEIWGGYLSPDPRPCPQGDECLNGWTSDYQWLKELTNLILMLDQETNASTRPLHPYLASLMSKPGVRPSGAIKELTSGLAGREPSSWGHDVGNVWTACKKIIAAAGLDPETWGICPTCGGLAHHPDDEQMLDEWEGTEPPTGPGFQMWETTSEGSPKTPVFETLDELCEYCAKHCTTFGTTHTASAEGWKQMLGDGFVSTVIAPGIIAI